MISFLIFGIADIQLAEKKFVWRIYIAAKALPTIKKVEIIRRKKFAIAALNVDSKIFIIHIATIVEFTIMLIYFFYKTPVALLKRTKISIKYSNISNFFYSDFSLKLLKQKRINNYSINLLDDQQLVYSLICSLEPVEQKTLKTYIDINLASSLIRFFKFFASTLILFVMRKYGSLCLYIDY